MVSSRSRPPKVARKTFWRMFMPHHLSAGPRVAHQVEQQANGDLQDVKDTSKETDATAAGSAMPQPHAQFTDPKPRPSKQQDHLGLRIIFRVPVGKGEN